ncbi:AI-2E family transporter [Xinfangfangia sp. D13-10-4-6]|uniref:AI-2E family transporter n=1 Tax=Pseudogemmobacter hezensis TaxID=2737662 RepID=UPI001557E83A|nr:AI-2E family transporter [Pseudogemmobacter hezensis]NPD14323.1 AI-2E family transporter [Pseudogemmobacter hezensis]
MAATSSAAPSAPPPRKDLIHGQEARHGFRRPLITDISAARWLLLAILAASVYFFYGFAVPVLAATVIAVASWPLRERSLPKLGRTLTASLLVLVLVCFLVLPILAALFYAFHELREWISWGFRINTTGTPPPHWLIELPQIGPWIEQKWHATLGHPGGLGELVQLISGENIGSIYRGVLSAGSSAFHLFLNLIFMLIALFVFYRDGDRVVEQIDRVGQRILPERWTRLSRIAPATISATVTGMTLIAIGEGVVLGIAYYFAGLPSPVTFAVITAVMALIPGGAPLSFTLASLYLAVSGSPWAGLALFVWGTVELFIVDKTIRPMLVGGPVRLPFLPTFFGLIGGVKTMGIVGLFVGPVLMALLMSIWREWQREIREDEERRQQPDRALPPPESTADG